MLTKLRFRHSVASLLHSLQEMEENEEEDLRKLDKMFAEIDGDGIMALA